MTEDQIERIAERKMDALDKRFMAGELSQPEYDKAVKDLDDWAQTEYVKLFVAAEQAKVKPAKRYQVYQNMFHLSDAAIVKDTWTGKNMGVYPTKAQAQARARLLNSRNGGK